MSLRFQIVFSFSLLLLSCHSFPSKKPVQNSSSSPSPDGQIVDEANPINKDENSLDAEKVEMGGSSESSVSLQSLDPNVLVLAPSLEDCQGSQEEGKSVPSLRRLIQEEYQNTLRDIFGITQDFTADLPPDAKSGGYTNLSELNGITIDRLAGYFKGASDIANDIMPRMKVLAGCEVVEGEICAKTFLDAFGTRIWRRPLTLEEKTALLGIYRLGASFSPKEGMSALIRSLLVSPHFLYRSEVGDGKSLNAFEMASAMSYFFWAAPPDDALLALAQAGTLLNEDILVAEANRLMADPKAKGGLALLLDVYTGYKGVFEGSKDPVKYKQFTDVVRQQLADESIDTFDYYIRSKKSGFTELFTWDTSVANPKLAAFYGVPALTAGGLDLLDHKATSRRGILGLASILSRLGSAGETHPVRRGEFVVEHLLCDKVLPLPLAADIEFPEPNPNLTNRERFAQHTSNPACSSCHVKLDGAGFGMEDYDSIGLLQSLDGDKPVDASGKVFDLDGKKELTFTGVGGLSQLLATSAQAKRCFALQAYQLAEGRLIKKPEQGTPQFESDRKQLFHDVCSVRKVADAFATTNLSVADMLVKIITNPIYQKRSPSTP